MGRFCRYWTKVSPFFICRVVCFISDNKRNWLCLSYSSSRLCHVSLHAIRNFQQIYTNNLRYVKVIAWNFQITDIFSSSGSGIGTCAAPLPCPLASGIIISPGTTADTFLHVLCDKEIRFFGRKNRVWGGDLSLSECRFECLEVQNSQCSTAKQTIWDCKIDLLTSQDWLSWRRFARFLTTGKQK